MATASKMTAGRLAAACARDAVAVELLLTCSMRVGNLVDLRLGETIRRFGEGATTRWAIEIPAPKVKNRQPLRFILPAESVQLLEHYLATWHAPLVRGRVTLAVPQRAGRARRRPAALGQHRPARPAPCRRRDHLPPVPPSRRRDGTSGRTRTGWGW